MRVRVRIRVRFRGKVSARAKIRAKVRVRGMVVVRGRRMRALYFQHLRINADEGFIVSERVTVGVQGRLVVRIRVKWDSVRATFSVQG